MAPLWRWGVDTNRVAAWRIIFLNAILITFFIVGAAYGVLFYEIGARLLAAFVPPILVGFAGVLLLNRAGHFRSGRVILIILFDLVITYYSASLGEATNIHHLFLAAMTLSLVLGEERERGFLALAMLLPVACWLLLEITDFRLPFAPHYSIAPPIARLVAGTITVTTTLLLFLSMMYLYRHTEDLERAMHKKLLQLEGEMRLARDIRTALQPAVAHFDGFDHAVLLLPKGDDGADCFDTIADRDEGPESAGGWIVCGRCTGRGVAAGLQQLMLQSTARTVLSTAPAIAAPERAAQQIVDALRTPLAEVGGEARVEITLLRLDAPGRLRVAGNCGGVLVHRFATRDSGAAVQSIVPTLEHTESIVLARGDRALYYSRGVADSIGPAGNAPLGIDGLGTRLRAVSDPPVAPEQTLSALRAQLFGWERRADTLLLAVAREDLFASFELSPDWRTIEQVRTQGAALLAELSPTIAEAALMTAIELAENAVKYGMREDGGLPPRIELFVDATMVEVAVVSRTVDATGVVEAQQLIDQINASGSAEQMYIDRMRRLMTEDDTGSGLGFLRISHEGGFTLSYEQEPDAFYILARRSLIG